MRLQNPPGGLPWALYAVTAASLVLNLVLLVKLGKDSPDAQPVAAGELAVEAPALEAPAVVAPEVVPATEAPVEAFAPSVDVPSDVNVVAASVVHSLARTFQNSVPAEQADVLSAVYARPFFWDLNLRTDLQKGDEVQVAYTWDGELAHVEAATYASKKLGKTLSAYRYTATGDTYASYWSAAGVEAAERLVDSPLHQYEQVTSLLKDRPTHKGMDFKVEVGADIVSPRSGKVIRTDWNWKYNGNCVEVQYNDGTLARFLHLSETTVKPGQSVTKGTKLGLSGNTGRSTAPHLHYELEQNGRVVDPIDYHGTTRRSLSETDMASFGGEVERLQAILDSAG
ncbi:MAG: M23 family peptidase [Deltaproteobacteria bacterium]|nr:MAG: M23 family peptidase [Deltaproteobacteria bacterium]